MDRLRDQLYCTELASQALEAWFDRTWEQIEPMLEGTWEHGDHGMPWGEARWFVKSAWTDGLNRAVDERAVDKRAGGGALNAARVPREAVPSGPPATH